MLKNNVYNIGYLLISSTRITTCIQKKKNPDVTDCLNLFNLPFFTFNLNLNFFCFNLILKKLKEMNKNLNLK